MNCFEWQNRSSDYLDGSLMGPLKKEADEHLEGCDACSERHTHYRQILGSIGAQAKVPMPVPIRRAPLALARPRLDLRARRSRWDRAPWFVRTSIEGLGIAFIILFVVAMVPRVRTLYEQSIERRLDAFSLSDLVGGGTSGADGSTAGGPAATAPLARGKVTTASEEEEGDEFGGSENEEDDAGDEGGDVRVGSSEIWRFNLKTDSPHEMRPRIVQILSELHVSEDTPGIGGIEAPGGIQFDILVSQHIVASIKNQLQKLASTSARNLVMAHRASGDGSTPSSLSESGTFTWYKNKSRRRIPPGKARVVIWLSLI